MFRLTGTLLSILLLAICVGVGGSRASEVPTSATAVCPILVGTEIPGGLVVRAPDGEELDLNEMLSQPSILVFFRGGWCPFCTQHFSALQDLEPELLELGYQLIGLSADRPGKAAELSARMNDSSFQLYSDAPMEVAAQLGLAYQVDDETLERLKGYSIDIEADSGYTHHVLPVPAALIVTDSVVRFVYANPDYRQRIDGDVLLAAARAAAKESGTGR